MTDETQEQERKVTVGGVEPSVLVKFLDVRERGDGTTVLRLADDDDGQLRRLEKGGNAILVTPHELTAISKAVQFKVVERESGTGPDVTSRATLPAGAGQTSPQTQSITPSPEASATRFTPPVTG